MAFWLRYTVIFATIFATSAIYNCYLLSNKVILLLDSSHYLITVRHLHAFCLQALSGHLNQGWTTLCGPQAAADIMIDGPILPAVGAIAYLISGMEPQAINWPVLAMALSACLATMGCCVGITIENCTQKTKHSVLIGSLTGLLSGINPEGLIAASRFLTELPSATILALIAALSSSMFFRRIKPIAANSIFFALPMLAFCGFLLKPALGFANFLLPGIMLSKAMISSDRKAATTAATMMICGLSAILIPWCAYTKQATGQIHISPERMPLFNLAKGNDLAVDAYSSDPSASTSQQIEQLGSVDKILLNTWSRDPIGLFAMYLRKLQRIVVTPWNDFMQTPYLIPESFTRLLHYYLILAALAGMLNLPRPSQTRRFVLFSAALCSMCISTLALYLPFEGICRYSYPLNPIIFMMCGFWHLTLSQKKLASKGKWIFCTILLCILLHSTYNFARNLQIPLAALTLAIAITYAFITFLWLKSTRKIPAIIVIVAVSGVVVGAVTEPDLYQFVSKVDHSQPIRLLCNLSKKTDSLGQTKTVPILLVNARPHPGGFSISATAGGYQQQLTPIPLELLDTKITNQSNLKRMYCEIFGRKSDDFFQWFACPLPQKLIESNGNPQATIDIAGCDIIHSRLLNDPHVSDWRYFSAGKLCNNPLMMDSRLTTSLPRQTALHNLRDNSTGALSQAQCFLLDIACSNIESPKQTILETQISPSSFDPIFRAPEKADCLLIDKTRLKMAQKIAASLQLTSLDKNSKFLQLSFEGCVKATKRDKMLGILITISNNSLGKSTLLPYCPEGVNATLNERKFEVKGLINLAALGFAPTSIEIALFPRDWPQYTLYGADRFCGAFEVKNLRLKVCDPQLPMLHLNSVAKY
jgi:hypothetical protein